MWILIMLVFLALPFLSGHEYEVKLRKISPYIVRDAQADWENRRIVFHLASTDTTVVLNFPPGCGLPQESPDSVVTIKRLPADLYDPPRWFFFNRKGDYLHSFQDPVWSECASVSLIVPTTK